jgi:hypothetical protein
MKRLKIVRAIIVPAVVAAALAGCQGGASAKPEPPVAIVSGKTTKAELLKQLGEPDKQTTLGNGKEEWLYLREKPSAHASWWRPSKSGLWVVLKNNVVDAFGERNSVEDQNSHKLWPF